MMMAGLVGRNGLESRSGVQGLFQKKSEPAAYGAGQDRSLLYNVANKQTMS